MLTVSPASSRASSQAGNRNAGTVKNSPIEIFLSGVSGQKRANAG